MSITSRRIFIVHLGVPCSWYTQDYFLQMSKMSEWANEQNEQMSKWANISTHLRKWANTFITKWANEQMSKWAKCPYEQIWCQMSTWNSNLLQKYPWVYHTHGTPGCTISELSLQVKLLKYRHTIIRYPPFLYFL